VAGNLFLSDSDTSQSHPVSSLEVASILVNSLPLLPVILHPQAWPYNADLLIPVVQTLTFHQAITTRTKIDLHYWRQKIRLTPHLIRVATIPLFLIYFLFRNKEKKDVRKTLVMISFATNIYTTKWCTSVARTDIAVCTLFYALDALCKKKILRHIKLVIHAWSTKRG
jgi:hypothetical protein